ncbi:MAG: alpha/beta hydrolase, partial [Planctomycetes bacterium]|nr:alpha/beta hydrolase [Planctomycetota bacterium]
VIEACAVPEVDGPPPARKGRPDFAAPGRIRTPPLESVRREFRRAETWYRKLGVDSHLMLAVSDDGTGPAGSQQALLAFLRGMGLSGPARPPGPRAAVVASLPDAEARQHAQFDQLAAFTQTLMHRSAKVRDRFWSKADRSSVEAWVRSTEFYRNYIWDEMIGRLPETSLPPNPRTRRILDTKAYTGYEVMLDAYPDVIAAGILLLPKGLKPNEKRPVVVCQHGLEGTPMDTITTEGRAYAAYKAFSAELAKRGFIVYAPQNPYRGGHEFRTIQRKSNPLKRSLFSYILRQHQQTLQWLSSLPNVDPTRIGFYGLSYGGKTAVRVSPLLKQYALSICSADFNEWIRKNVSSEDRYSYVFTGEYEMFEWNMGHVANYAELASLMVPRPFMVERGHRDGVAPDEWVAWEYAKVRRVYDELGIGDRTEIEFFNGPHTINGQGTYCFLHRFLNPPGDSNGKSAR